MEWTKESLKKSYVICKNVKQAQKAVEIYEAAGYEFWGRVEKDMLVIGSVGIFENRSIPISVSTMNLYKNDKRFTKIPNSRMFPRRKFPREMMVSDDEINWRKRMVIAKANDEYIYITKRFKLESYPGSFVGWKYAKEIDQ
jgi:hypothetical protein